MAPRRPVHRVKASAPRRLWLQSLSSALVTLGVIGLVVLGASVWALQAAGPPARQGDATTVILRKGAGVSEVAGDLAQAGVIRSAAVFIAAAEITRAAPKLKAGEYAFPSRASLAQVLRKIRSGDIVHHRITIAEGLTSQQAVDMINGSDVLVGQIPTPPEGSILPETYDVTRGEQRAAVLQKMMDARDRVVSELWAHHKPGLPFQTADQAVVLASIVEKETALPEERPRVAAVYVNRLRLGMRLQADPTVIYGITGGLPLGRGIRKSELEALNPYNTYAVAGLPPGPIGNPGRASLAAAMDPPDTKELYFVADGTGGHVFAATNEEQAKNVAHWRQIEKDRQQSASLAAVTPQVTEHR
jgi:UPF0755 protein